MMTLDNRCMYAAFGEAVQKKGHFIIQRSLKSCETAFADAKTHGLSFAILFADAAFDSSTLVSWSIVSKIHFDGNQTTVEFSPATPLTTPVSVSKLRKVADGEPISTGIRRGQILCDTPSFLKSIILDKQQSPEKPRAAAAYLFLWNPKKDPESFEDYDQVQKYAASGRSYTTRWICPSIKPRAGDLAIVQRTGNTNNGLFAMGHVTHAPFDDSGNRVVGLKLDSFLPIGSEISRMEIVKAANYKKNWAPMASGNIIPDQLLLAIRSLWAARTGRSNTEQVPASRIAAGGGGFGSPIENKKVEASAMRFVSRWYRTKGWKVTDVSAKCLGYDLHCIKGRQIAHVEVKGSSGADRKFIITANEMHTWEVDPLFVLSLVTNVNNKPLIHQFFGAQEMKSLRFTALSYMAVSNR